MEHVCSGKPKDQSQFYGHETYAIAQGYMLMRSHAWFNVLLMLSWHFLVILEQKGLCFHFALAFKNM